MTNAKHDDNWVPTLIGVSSADGTTTIPAEIDPNTGELLVKASVSVSGADGAITDGVDPDIKATVVESTSTPGSFGLVAVNPDGSDISGGGSGSAAYSDSGGVDRKGLVDADRHVQTDVVGALPAGNNNIGDVDVATLPALAAGTNNIGDVDVLTVGGQAPAFGTGTRSSSTQRVTIATDDVVPASQSGSWSVTATQAIATNLKAQAENYQGGSAVSSSNPLEVNLRSTTGNVSENLAQVNGQTVNVGTGAAGTGTQRVTTSTDSTIGTVTSVTQNADVRQATASNLNAQVVGNAASAASDSGNPVKVGGRYNSTPPTLTNGQRGDLQLDASGNLNVNINSNVGGGSSLSTNNSSTSVLGAGATFTGTADDALLYSEIRVNVIASHASATDGLSIQQSSNGTNWDITDTYTIPATTGKTFVVPRQARYIRIVYTNGGTLQTSFRLQTILNRSGAASSSQRSQDAYTNETDLDQSWAFNSHWNGTTWDRMRGDTTTGTYIGGAIAHDGIDSGNPVKIGGKARTAPPTAVAASDRVDAMYDIYGKQIVREALREDLGNQQTTITSSTGETTIVTADATYKLDLYGLVITNISSTYTKVTIKDSTSGTTRFVFSVPAQETRGFSVSPSGAHKQNAANNNWTATCGTSVASIEITAMWVRSL